MKTPLIVLVAFFLGAGAFYAYSKYSALETENMNLKQQGQQPTAGTVSTEPATSETVEDDSPVVGVTGTASGTLGYPSEGIPPLNVYAFNKEEDSYVVIKTIQNQSTFTFEELEPGMYTFVAYPQNTDQLAGGYTKAVPCGLLASCTDHSLIEVEVTAGDEATGIEIKDWYAPQGTLPAKP